VLGNSITKNINYEIGLYTVDQPSLGFIYSQLEENCIAYSLNSDGSFAAFGNAPVSNFIYDFTTWGSFIFGFEDSQKYYLICEKCWVRIPNITQQIASVFYWNNDHTPIQIKWFEYSLFTVCITTTNLCYSFRTIGATTLISYQPPPGKTFNQVFLGNISTIYCNTTDFLNFKLGSDKVWTPILNIDLPECGRISMNPSGINFSGEILNYNGFQFKSNNDVLQILDSSNSPVMTITKGLGIPFNYPIIS
jgi:hypothetical protein